MESDVMFTLKSIGKILIALALYWAVCFGFAGLVVGCQRATASTIPTEAQKHRPTLVRAAHAVWGIDAPIATFAAQVHQESRWNANARSPVGAQGMAQFMPGTAVWIAQIYPRDLAGPRPYSPGWALRALVTYDKYLFNRNQATHLCDRWAMTLAAYNGGLGWVQRDRKLASEKGSDKLAWFNSIENFNAGRSSANFAENRHYPRVILFKWESLYAKAGWGNGVCLNYQI